MSIGNLSIKELATLPNGTYISQNMGIDIKEVLRDVCHQVDDKLVLCSMLILTGFIFMKIIYPMGIKELKATYPVFFKPLSPYIDYLLSFSETAMLGGCMFIFGFYIIQNGWYGGYKLWTITLGIFIGLAILSKVLEWKRQRIRKIPF